MSVRDLEQEGVLPAPAKSMGGGELSVFMAVVQLQSDIKRLNEVMAGLAAKVRALEGTLPKTDAKGFYVKEEFRTS